MIQPLDWPQLVAEALRRRKAEGLTQQAHADLAGVSKPVIIAFDKGETTLSLGRALAILKVVGLVQEGPPPGSHAAFVAAARARWQDLIAPLPADDPARHPLGGYQVNYQIKGELRKIESGKLLKSLSGIAESLPSALKLFLGWCPFWIPTWDAISPRVMAADLIECWLGDPEKRVIADPAHTDFWRISGHGSSFLERGFDEDGPRMFEPGTIFDLSLPIWHLSGALLHAAGLAELLAVGPSKIKLTATYHGLTKRMLAAWAKPSLKDFANTSHRILAYRVDSTITVTPERIREDLASVVHELAAPLYQGFEGFRLPHELVDREVAELMRQTL